MVLTQRDTDDPKNQVVAMQPPAGTQVADDSKVTLFWSDGPEQVPSVRGKTEAEAHQADRGGRVQGERGDRLLDAGDEGDRAAAEPRTRAPPLNKGSTVTIVVSTYTPPSPTPTPTLTPTPTAPTTSGLPTPTP